MMKKSKGLKGLLLFFAACSITFTMGCHTSTQVITPEKTQLYVKNRPIVLGPTGGQVVTRPFFWSEVNGIPYTLVKDGTVVQTGKLASSFRIVSIFWPPYAFIYWPFGYDLELYDLTKDPMAQKFTPGQNVSPAPQAK
jgi:hypothetical protein